MLKWTQDDINTFDNDNARVLGSPLEDGYCLYRDLQSKYKKTVDSDGNDLRQKVNKTTEGESKHLTTDSDNGTSQKISHDQ